MDKHYPHGDKRDLSHSFLTTPKKLDARIITPIFKDQKNGVYKIISFYAKKARGLMSRYIIQNKLTDPEAIKDFNLEGYIFKENVKDHWLFIRENPEMHNSK